MGEAVPTTFFDLEKKSFQAFSAFTSQLLHFKWYFVSFYLLMFIQEKRVVVGTQFAEREIILLGENILMSTIIVMKYWWKIILEGEKISMNTIIMK